MYCITRAFTQPSFSRFKAITFVNAVNPEIYAFFYLRKHIAPICTLR